MNRRSGASSQADQSSPEQGALMTQRQLVAALRAGHGFPSPGSAVRLFETHISWVLLYRRQAYKIKKAVNLGFLDFTTLEQRRHYCHEEIRLNRRLAPDIYLDVVPIGGSPAEPVIGAEPAIEYAVRMRRFSPQYEMDRLIAQGALRTAHVDSLAAVLAAFHTALPPIEPSSPDGTPETLRQFALDNFVQLPDGQLGAIGRFIVAALRETTAEEFAACESVIAARRREGFVRECHGDLHLGNIVVRRGKAVPFDGIEFDPALRWTDVMADVAFAFMDFLYHDHPDLAYRFLNGWLENTGDYAGLAVLRFYASYRAAVRAKVNAIRAAQAGVSSEKAALARQAFRRYLGLACQCLLRDKPALIITHGLPGSGKTTFSQEALARFGAIRLRSDVERKRLFGLSPLDSSRSLVAGGIYDSQATARTYDKLHDLARTLLQQGYRVIVDAAFLRREERDHFRRLAQEMAASFVIASIQASESLLRTRIEARMRSRRDASEADLAVLEKLQAHSLPFGEDEHASIIAFTNEGDMGFVADDSAWSALAARLG